MIARQRGENSYYYLSRKRSPRSSKREEVALGSELSNALAEYEQITGLPADPGRPVQHRPWLAKDLHAQCRRRAKARSIEFRLTVDDIQQLLDRSGGRCMLTGIKFSFLKMDGERRRKWIPSIDRIDSDLPYAPENVRLVCCAVNIALNEFGEAFLIHIARELLRHKRFRSNHLRNIPQTGQ